jgi:hypothetical protein
MCERELKSTRPSRRHVNKPACSNTGNCKKMRPGTSKTGFSAPISVLASMYVQVIALFAIGAVALFENGARTCNASDNTFCCNKSIFKFWYIITKMSDLQVNYPAY